MTPHRKSSNPRTGGDSWILPLPLVVVEAGSMVNGAGTKQKLGRAAIDLRHVPKREGPDMPRLSSLTSPDPVL